MSRQVIALILPQAETIVQGVNLGIVLAAFVVLYRAAQEDNPLRAKARWAVFLSGISLVVFGLLLGLFREGPAIDALLLKHLGFDTGAISLGYALVVVSIVSFLRSGRGENQRSD